jgi:uncharacterized protein (TIGR02271 family)
VVLKDVSVPRLDPRRFEGVLDADRCRRFVRRLEQAADRLAGRRLWQVNSTGQGGGVAEMLYFLLGYLAGAGIDTHWTVIQGNQEFFEVTKRIHHLLHGQPGDGNGLDQTARAVYEQPLEKSLQELQQRVAPLESATILDAPSVALGEEISDATAVALRRYYRLGDPAAPAEGDDGQPSAEPFDARTAVPDATTTEEMATASTEPSGTMIRSEEELRVRIRQRARRIRIKRYVVTDYVTTTIPVRREELRLEEAPVDEASLTAPPALPGEGREMVLHQEELVVSTRVVARERVRLRVQTVTERRRISGEVRKERIEVDDRDVGPSTG